jgi:hypothetical protein
MPLHAGARLYRRKRLKLRCRLLPSSDMVTAAILLAAAIGGGFSLELTAVSPTMQEPAGTGVTNADLRLEATANIRVMVGEFLAIRTTVTAKHRVTLCDREVGVQINAGRGFVDHVEAFEGWQCLFGGNDLAAGRSFVAAGVIGLEAVNPPAHLEWPASVHASARFVFDRPGIYRIRTRLGDAVSNVIVVEAVRPAGSDARLLAALRERPAVLSFYAAAHEVVRLEGERLLAEFGPRPLLQPFIRHAGIGDASTSR